ncbi:putative F-box protein At3g10430 [Populus alba]|uniref:putative F-box protein At3g10430 n=1 Tax=Populus alba TaxID=43335 RepID=UPI00158B72B1|nr:putative F-box protein At3g10430 [Populus alba]
MDDTKEEVPNTIVTKLSADVMIDILSRFHWKTVLSFRCVCKTWLRLISDKDFADSYLSRSLPGILIKALPEGGISSLFHLFQIHEETDRTFKVGGMELVPETNLPATANIELMNSCNGLLCLSGGELRNVIHVCNPILCEYIEIHVDDHKTCLYGNYFALGCSATGNQYKVLRTFYQNDQHRCPKAEIYTIKTGHWRSVGNGFSIGRLDFNTSLHGCIHWARYETSLECICSFDFESEQFKRLPAPPICDGNLDGFTRLGVLRDCLSVTVRKWDAPYEIHDTHAIAYNPSFVSLHHIAAGEEQVLRTNTGLTEIPLSLTRGSEDPTEKGYCDENASSIKYSLEFVKGCSYARRRGLPMTSHCSGHSVIEREMAILK